MSKRQVKIDDKWKDFMDCDIVGELKKEFERLKKTSEKGKEIAFTKNLVSLANGEFGIDTNSPETLLAYWKAQELAGYPCADENVRYFEERVRKNERNGSN